MAAVEAFIEGHNVEHDPTRPCLGHIITNSAAAKEALGYEQMDYFTPIRLK